MKHLFRSKENIFYTISISLMIMAMILMFFFRPCVVNGFSMENTLHDGERHMMYHNWHIEPEYGDIVIVRYDNFDERHLGLVDGSKRYSLIIKRVIGVPGDTIEIRENMVYLNAQKLHEPYLKAHDAFDDMEPYTLSDDEYFVMGDNREESLDSRLLGPVFQRELYGILIK